MTKRERRNTVSIANNIEQLSNISFCTSNNKVDAIIALDKIKQYSWFK